MAGGEPGAAKAAKAQESRLKSASPTLAAGNTCDLTPCARSAWERKEVDP